MQINLQGKLNIGLYLIIIFDLHSKCVKKLIFTSTETVISKRSSQSQSAISRGEDWTAILSHRDVGDEFD